MLMDLSLTPDTYTLGIDEIGNYVDIIHKNIQYRPQKFLIPTSKVPGTYLKSFWYLPQKFLLLQIGEYIHYTAL